MWPGIQANDDAGLLKAVDPSTYVRGLMYAQHGAVMDVAWEANGGIITGAVVGSARQPYSTVAFVRPAGPGNYVFVEGRCTCPVGFDCKHVVALVATALSAGLTGARPPQPQPAAWTRSLDSLLHGAGGGPHRDEKSEIAVELSLSSKPRATGRWEDAAGTRPRLLARLVRPGRSGWVAGDLSWSRLRLRAELADGPIEQLRWLRQFYLLYEAGRQDSSFYVSHARDEKYLDLTAFESTQLWPLLDAAAAMGIRLVRGKKGSADVDGYGSARLELDVTSDQRTGDLVIVPVLIVDGVSGAVVPLHFIGDDGHGVVHAPQADVDATTNPQGWRFGLAKLDRPVGRQLQQLALSENPLMVPAADAERFRDEYVPRLQRLATVVSSDGSFVPPDVSGPMLVARADYGDDHGLELDWEWRYAVGDTERRVPLDQPHTAGPGDGFRDPAAERELLAILEAGLDGFGPRSGERFDGLDTMRFSTEALPRLRDLDDIEVEVTGDPADYREVGDSLVIGVSTESTEDDADWFDLGVSIIADGNEVPFTDVFTALARDEPYLLLPDGGYFSLEKPELQSLRRLIEEARALGDQTSDGARISRFQAGLWEELAELGVVTYQADSWKRQVHGLLALGALDDVAVPPATLRAELRPYQLDGYRWLTFLWENGLGGILADDMGLGKTLQTLALICHAKQADPDLPPFLVVAPTSVVSNWVTEAARFAPGLTVVPVTDTLRRRGQSLEDVVAGADVVVTTYTLMRLDADAYGQARWSGLVLDEAQHVKNHQSKTYQAARKLPVPFKLAVTGTPVENNLMELWSQLSIAAPGLFPHPRRFEEYYGRPIERQGDADRLAQFRRRIKPLVLRRTKEQVAADLPAKQEQVLEVELHPKHRKVYDKHLQRERQRVLGLLDDVDKNRLVILRSLTLLRQLSLHAGLVDDEHIDLASAKIDLLIEQLGDVIDGGHRALVFSQFTGFLGLVRERLEAAGVEYCYLDGSTRHREQVIAQFKEGSAPVFLISLKAGGFGLNLTEADYCFILDPWWNPATEAQAVDRTHRIGQTRNVMVYRLIAADTIEQKVMALKDRKAKLSASVMDDGNAFGGRLDVDDIRNLLE